MLKPLRLSLFLLLTAVCGPRCVEVVVFTRLLLPAGTPKIPYRPTAGPGEVMCFKHYNAEEVGWGAFTVTSCACLRAMLALIKKQICRAQVLMGKKMEDWLRFSVCYWHSFCATGTEDALERFALLFVMH